MANTFGPPASYVYAPYVPLEITHLDLDLSAPFYHWGFVFLDGTKPEMYYKRRTMPYQMAMKAELIIRYDFETWEPVVVKSRYCQTPCSLEAAVVARDEQLSKSF